MGFINLPLLKEQSVKVLELYSAFSYSMPDIYLERRSNQIGSVTRIEKWPKTHNSLLYLINPFTPKNLSINSSYCLPYIAHNGSSENLVLNQTISPS